MYRSGPEHNSPVMGTNHRLQVTIRLYGRYKRILRQCR